MQKFFESFRYDCKKRLTGICCSFNSSKSNIQKLSIKLLDIGKHTTHGKDKKHIRRNATRVTPNTKKEENSAVTVGSDIATRRILENNSTNTTYCNEVTAKKKRRHNRYHEAIFGHDGLLTVQELQMVNNRTGNLMTRYEHEKRLLENAIDPEDI